MKVTLIDYQPNALEILLYTKNTRLQGAQSLLDIMDWPYMKKLEHLGYMKNTIQSSWEFANYIFEIEGVSRAFTHQLVRTRTAAYAQESQRTVDVRKSGFLDIGDPVYKDSVGVAMEGYIDMINRGVPVQDARNVLPTGILTNIIMGADLRTLSHMAELRLCKRTQGEYQEVFKEMRDQVINVHPWAEEFLEVYCVKTGTCFFPNYTQCPVQQYTVGYTDDHKDMLNEKWHELDHVAIPVAKDGKTQ